MARARARHGTYAYLLYRALKSRPDHSMTLADIHKWFQENTSKPDDNKLGWQDCIQYNLQHNMVGNSNGLIDLILICIGFQSLLYRGSRGERSAMGFGRLGGKSGSPSHEKLYWRVCIAAWRVICAPYCSSLPTRRCSDW